MAPGRRAARRHRPDARRPGLGPRRALPPGPRPQRHVLHPARRLPGRRGRLRRGLLRHLPARGAGDGPAAAAAAGDRLGGAGARRDRPGRAARQRHRRLRRRDRAGLRTEPAPRARRGDRRLRPDRFDDERRLRAHRLQPRAGGPGGDRGHGLLLVPGRDPPGRAVAARRGVLDGAGRRRDRAVRPGDVHRVQPPARAGRRRPVQAVRGRRRRHRLGRGRRRAGAGAAGRRAPPGPPRAGRDPRAPP